MATLTPMGSPVLFAVDSATETLLLAACGPGGEASAIADGGARASAELMPRASALLASVGLGWSELDAIGYGRGPGAFTGLRTACAVAQGLAVGLQRPVLPIDSLLIVAQAARAALVGPVGQGANSATSSTAAASAEAPACASDGRTEPETWVIAQDARMSELYVAFYEHGPAGWRVLTPPALWPAAEASPRIAALGRPAFAAGTGHALLQSGSAALPGLRWIDAPAWEPRRAQALLHLAQRAWAQGQQSPARDATLHYVRDKVALTTAERAARATAAAGLPPAPPAISEGAAAHGPA